MKSMYRIFSIVTLLAFYGCTSTKNYSSSSFSSGFYKDKSIVFILTDKSENEPILVDGPFIGSINTRQNNRALFKKGIEELANETGLDLKYTNEAIDATEPGIVIESDLKLIQLTFGFSAATTETMMRYTIKKENKTIPITGKYKKGGGGSETSMVYHSLKNANYLLLKELEKTGIKP